MGIEARHAAWINSAVRKMNPWNTAFEVSIYIFFLKGCQAHRFFRRPSRLTRRGRSSKTSLKAAHTSTTARGVLEMNSRMRAARIHRAHRLPLARAQVQALVSLRPPRPPQHPHPETLNPGPRATPPTPIRSSLTACATIPLSTCRTVLRQVRRLKSRSIRLSWKAGRDYGRRF